MVEAIGPADRAVAPDIITPVDLAAGTACLRHRPEDLILVAATGRTVAAVAVVCCRL